MDITALATDYIIPVVAVTGLALSLYNTYRHWKEYRPNTSLEFSYQESVFDPRIGDIPLQCYILLVKNLGNVNIIIDFVGVRWKNKEYKRDFFGSTLTEEYQDFPYKLSPGSTLSVEFPRKEIEKNISKTGLSGSVKITGFVSDGSGKRYSSLPIVIDIK
jgi:hypothetical protein